jgi:hypothetical protein
MALRVALGLVERLTLTWDSENFKIQKPWACILQGKRSDVDERAQAERALRALFGAWFDPGVGPEYPRPRIPEL